MVKRPCLGVGGQPCGVLTARPDHRCPDCAKRVAQPRNAVKDARRGSARARGYDRTHDRTRARLLPAAIDQPCPRCGQPMLAGQPLDAGHSTDLRLDRTARADRIEHAACNRQAGGQASHAE